MVLRRADLVRSTYNLPGRDSTEYSTTDTLGVAGASQVALPNDSKRPPGNHFLSHFSFT